VSYLSSFTQSNRIVEVIHAFLSSNGILSIYHLDECMPFFLIDNAGLDPPKAAEDAPNLTFSSASTSYEQGAAQNFDMVTW
jgi:hypothetical protein